MTLQSADQRREQVLAAAVREFAAEGLHGATTARIAAAVGISQPYVMHLFGSKKGLFLASVEEGARRLGELIDQVHVHEPQADAVAVLGAAYDELVREHPELMRLQLQSWAAATADEEIRTACAAHFAGLWDHAAEHFGLTRRETAPLMASLTFFNVVVALGLQRDDDCAVAPLLAQILPAAQPPAQEGDASA